MHSLAGRIKSSYWSIDPVAILIAMLNPFQASAPFPYPLKTSENQRFCDVFRVYRRTLAWNGLNVSINFQKLQLFWRQQSSIIFYMFWWFPWSYVSKYNSFFLFTGHVRVHFEPDFSVLKLYQLVKA